MDNKVMNQNSEAIAGVVGYFPTPTALIRATEKVRDQNYQSFDCYTPFPVHGLEKAQGLRRSPLPFVTMGAGLAGFMSAVALQHWTSVTDWPINVGGKPLWSWPAFVPIMFEITVLFAGLATVGAMFLLNGLPNIKRRAFDANITRDRFALMIDAPKNYSAAEKAELEEDEIVVIEKRQSRFKKFDSEEAKKMLLALGATEVTTVPVLKGWFEGWFD